MVCHHTIELIVIIIIFVLMLIFLFIKFKKNHDSICSCQPTLPNITIITKNVPKLDNGFSIGNNLSTHTGTIVAQNI